MVEKDAAKHPAPLSSQPMAQSPSGEVAVAQTPDSSKADSKNGDLSRGASLVSPSLERGMVSAQVAALITDSSSAMWTGSTKAQWLDMHRDLVLSKNSAQAERVLHWAQRQGIDHPALPLCIKLAGDLRLESFKSWLFEHLEPSQPSHLRAEALLSLAQMGETSIEPLAISWVEEAHHADLLENGIVALGLIGGQKAQRFLHGKVREVESAPQNLYAPQLSLLNLSLNRIAVR